MLSYGIQEIIGFAHDVAICILYLRTYVYIGIYIRALLFDSLSMCNIHAFTLLVFARYYEVKIHTPGMIRVGWTRPHLPAGVAVGSDHNSYAFDGYAVRKFPLHCSESDTRFDLLYILYSTGAIMNFSSSSISNTPYIVQYLYTGCTCRTNVLKTFRLDLQTYTHLIYAR